MGLKGKKEQINSQIQACPVPTLRIQFPSLGGYGKGGIWKPFSVLKAFCLALPIQPSLVHSPSMWTGERDSPQVEHFQAATECIKRKNTERKREKEILVHRREIEATPCEPCKHAVCCVCVQLLPLSRQAQATWPPHQSGGGRCLIEAS